MKRPLPLLMVIAFSSSTLFAQELPPPRNPAGGQPDEAPQAPILVAPQNSPQQAPNGARAGQAAKKTRKQQLARVVALRQAQRDRKQARVDRMNEFKAARAVEEQKLYQDWHERYLADAPVRVEYYRAQAVAYQSQPVLPYFAPYFYAAEPPLFLAPFYAPIVAAPIYCQPFACGAVFSCGW